MRVAIHPVLTAIGGRQASPLFFLFILYVFIFISFISLYHELYGLVGKIHVRGEGTRGAATSSNNIEEEGN